MMKSADLRWGGGVTLLLIILIILPLFAVLLNAVLPGIFFGRAQYNGFSLLLELFHRPLWRTSMMNSVTLGFGAATFGTLLGGVLAMLRAQWDFAVGRLLDAAAWALLIAPSFMIAQGWVLFANPNGIVYQWLGWTWVTSFIFQPAGLMFVMALSKFPLAYFAVLAASEWGVKQFGHAARLCGAGPFTVWRTVQLPLSTPSFLAGWTLVFIDTIGDFGLPAALATVYRYPTLPYSIYTAIYQSPVRFDMAGVLAFYLVLLLGLAMAMLVFAIRRSRFDFLNAKAIRVVKQKPHRSWPLNLFAGIVLLVSIGIPLGTSAAISLLKQAGDGFVRSNITLVHYAQLFGYHDISSDHRLLDFAQGLVHSLSIAGIAAVLSMLLGFVAAYVLTFTDFRYKGLVQLFSIVSLAVPGIVLGIGYIFIWNQKWLEPIGLHLYGTPSLLVLAAIAGAIPYAVRVQLGAFGNLSGSMLKAASIQGASILARMLHIVLPLTRNSLLLATLAAFGTCVFDLATASMLKPPNFVLTPLVIDRAFEFSRYGYAAAATVVSGCTVILIILALQLVGKGLFVVLDRRSAHKKEDNIHGQHTGARASR